VTLSVYCKKLNVPLEYSRMVMRGGLWCDKDGGSLGICKQYSHAHITAHKSTIYHNFVTKQLMRCKN